MRIKIRIICLLLLFSVAFTVAFPYSSEADMIIRKFSSSGGSETITYVGTNTANGTGTDIPVAVPAGSVGDILIAGLCNDSDANGEIDSETWATIASVDASSSRQMLFSRVADGTETNINFHSGTGLNVAVFVSRFSKTGGTWSTITYTTATSGETDVASLESSSTSVSSGDMLVGSWGYDGEGLPTGVPTGPGEVVMTEAGTDTRSSVSIAAYYESISSTASITRTATYASAADQCSNIMAVIGVE